MQLAGGFPSKKVTERHRAVNSHDPGAPAAISLFDIGPEQEEIKSFTDSESQRKFAQREPLLSAAVHLGLGDIRSALQKLLLANLPEFALSIAQQFMPAAVDQVLTMILNKTAHFV